MIELKPEQTIDEFCGFTVYDAETGEPVNELDILTEHLGDVYEISGRAKWSLSEDGELWVTMCGKSFAIDKDQKRKLLIQFGDGKYLRW